MFWELRCNSLNKIFLNKEKADKSVVSKTLLGKKSGTSAETVKTIKAGL